MRRFWDSVIQPVFDAENIKDVIEIGSDKGENTKNILQYVDQKGGMLYSIDPFPSFPWNEWETESNGRFKMFRDLSLNVLDKIESADAILIDGDHNWYTVYHELLMIKNHFTKKFPLVFFHDICWPYDRRDLYYNPENIPSIYRHEYKKAAISVDSNSLTECGMNSFLYNACEYGTEKNGVKTAVEDFIRDFPGLNLKYYEFGVIHGLGMIASPDEYAHAVSVFTSMDICNKVLALAEKDRLRVQMLLEKCRLDCRILKNEIYSLKESNYFLFKIYPDFGGGFSEKTAIKKEYLSGSVIESVTFEKAPLRIRIDPVDSSYCIVSDVRISTNNGFADISSTNGTIIDNLYLFDTFDSKIIVENSGKATYFSISMFVSAFNSPVILESLNKINGSLAEIKKLSDEKILVENRLADVSSMKAFVEDRLADVTSEKQSVENELAEVTSEKQSVENELAEVTSEKQSVENKLAEVTSEKQSVENKLAEITSEKQFVENKYAESISQKSMIEKKLSDAIAQNNKLSIQLKKANNEVNTQKTEVTKLNSMIHADEVVSQKLVSYSSSIGWLYAIKSILKNGISATVCNVKGINYIRKNGGFDFLMYCRQNKDVLNKNFDPLLHFVWFGGYEGRNPSYDFNSEMYLKNYFDVSESGINPYVHYLLYGKDEGRQNFASKKIKPLKNAKASDVIETIADINVTSAKQEQVKNNQQAFRVNEESSTLVNDVQKNFSYKSYNFSGFSEEFGKLENKKITIIVPIYNAYEETAECIESVISNTDFPHILMLINDCSTDKRIDELLNKYRDHENIQVVSNDNNLGFVRTVNYGITHSENDVVFLNSDTRVSKGWLTKLAVAAYHLENVATVTPFSNAAGAFSVPVMGENKNIPAGFDLDTMSKVVERASKQDYVRVPTGNGFCMYVTRKAIDKVGVLDYEAFSRGYGEENDFCMRAKQVGFINIIADDTYIYHKRSASFKEEKLKLIENNRKILDNRYPTYSQEIKIFSASDTLIANRAKIKESVEGHDCVSFSKKRILYVLHEGTGGTVKTNEDLMSFVEKNDYEVYMLTSNAGQMKLYSFNNGVLFLLNTWMLSQKWDIANFYVREYADIYFDVIFNLHIDLIHVRHLFKHSFDVIRIAEQLKVPVALSFHDFYFICPTINLVNSDNKYCNAECRNCDKKCRIPSALININAPINSWVSNIWRKEINKMLKNVSAFVTTSEYTRQTYLKVYPEIEKRFYVIEHGRDFSYSRVYRGNVPSDNKIVILLAGNIDVNKGGEYIEQLLDIDKEHKLEFHCIGALIGDTNKKLKDRIICHGKYKREEFSNLISQIKPAYIGIFSIWPETYCHVLSEAWSCGIPCIVSDLGTLKERAEINGGCIKADLENAVKTYNQIIDVSFSKKYNELCEQVHQAKINSIAQMGSEYAALYHKIIYNPCDNIVLFWINNFTDKRVGSSYLRVVSPIFNNPVIRRNMTVIELHNAADIPFGGETIDELNVLIQREKIESDSIEIIKAQKKSGMISKVFFEIDDDLLSIDKNHPEYSLYCDNLNKILSIKEFSSQLITTSENIVKKFDLKFNILPNYIDNYYWNVNPMAIFPSEKNSKNEYRILYFGTISHNNDLIIMEEPMLLLNQMLEKTGKSAKLIVVGCTNKKGSWYDQLAVPGESKEYPKFVRWLKENNNFDIGISPLSLDNEMNYSKSCLKFLENTALGLPFVGTDIAPYRQVVKNGENGFLIKGNNSEQWAEALYSLITDDNLRKQIYENAHNDLINKFMLHNHFDEITHIFTDGGK